MSNKLIKRAATRGSALVASILVLSVVAGRFGQSNQTLAQDAAGQSNGASVQNLFATHCSACHGNDGQGNGDAAYLTYPRPRDFTAGVYRFKSTPGDALPTRQDLTRTIRQGVPGTAMPSFGSVLSDGEIASLVEYVLQLNQNAAAQPAEPVTIPAQPTFTSELSEHGKRVYATMGCAACHGETGRGDGPSSHTLKDANGFPLPPADFSTGVYKSGPTDADLYRTLLVGVAGTPMPGFASALEQGIKVEGVPEDVDMVWALVAYLRSIQSASERPGVASGAALRPVVTADGAMFDDAAHSGWDSVEPTSLAVQPIWQRRGGTRNVEVRMARSHDRLAICLDWPDASMDAGLRVDRFTDAAAVMFSLTGNPISLTMGGPPKSESPDRLVYLWHWKAARQLNADRGQWHDVWGDVQAQANVYPFKEGDPSAGPLTEHDSTYITAWGAGNLQSSPEAMNLAALESNAAGFGSLTLQPAQEQQLTARAVWRQGRWRVVIVRPLAPRGDGDVDLQNKARLPFTIAVWDGSAGDRNGTKLISGWHWLDMQ